MKNPFSTLFRALRRSTERRTPDEPRLPYSGRSLAGVLVTADTAITVPAVWACIQYISQTIGQLPWSVMRETDAGQEPWKNHPVHYLINSRPSIEWSSMQFRETLTHWALRWGNGYAEIERDSMRRPAALWPIHPDRVDVKRRSPEVGGALFYLVNNGTDKPTELASHDMFHIRGFGEGVVGVNVMRYAAESIGWARAAQLFGAAFFGNGMNIDGVIQGKKAISEPAKIALEAELQQKYRGARNSRKTIILDNEMEWKGMAVDPQAGQLIETQSFLIEEVCRWFGVPPQKVQHLVNAHYRNVENLSIQVVQDCIMPWARRWQDEADFKLFGARAKAFTLLDLNDLLRGDQKARADAVKVYRDSGVLSPNDARRMLDLNPIPAGDGGDKYTMQSQNTTLEKIGEEPPPAAVPPGLVDDDPDDDELGESDEDLEDMADDAEERVPADA